MSRLDHAGLTTAVSAALGAVPDTTGSADLVFDKGNIVIASDPTDFKAAFARLKKIEGYRWIAINRDDLFAANSLSIGSKAGILDARGAVLKAADLPRRRM